MFCIPLLRDSLTHFLADAANNLKELHVCVTTPFAFQSFSQDLCLVPSFLG